MLRRRSNFAWVVLIVIVFLLYRSLGPHPLPQGSARKSLGYRNKQTVQRKTDLLNADISQALKRQPWDLSPINQRIIKQKYEDEEVVAFASNLDVDKVLVKKAKAAKKNEQDGNQLGLTFGSKDYKNSITCEDLAYRSVIQHSQEKAQLHDDLAELRHRLMTVPNFLSKEVTGEDEEEMTVPEIIEKKWYQFGSSAVWLESEQCFVVYSRVIYSSNHIKNHPHLSLVRAQAFDKDWNEIKGKRIPYVDVPRPADMQAALRQIDEEIGISDCSVHRSNQLAYDACVVENTRNGLAAEKRRESILSKFYMTYPTILNIPFKTDGDWKGPEDPHVVLRRTEHGEEPVVIYNIRDEDLDRRIMVAFLPHRKIEPMVKFSIGGREQREIEKNWTPFFHRNVGESLMSRGFIHFIYSFSPLEILKCSLNDGVCNLVFEADTLKISESNKFGGIRGGTQFIPLPDVLPQVDGAQVWIGFPKQHIDECGCGSVYYRPMFSVLVERDGVYSQEMMVPAMGFNMDVLAWDLKTTACKETNILSPNSIAYWGVAGQDPHTRKYEDYLIITVSEADSISKVITLKGVLNYILGIYREKDIMEKFAINEQADEIIGQTLHCLISSAFDSCKAYGEAHPEIKEEDKQE